jgi:hypothetical protein
MTNLDLSIDSLLVGRQLSHHAVGFCSVKQRDGHDDDAVSAGSGTLVRIGRVTGIITAAHVLRDLLQIPRVGLLRFPASANTVQRQMIEIEQPDTIILDGAAGPDGPDLAFLRLPIVNEANLAATNTFYEVARRRDVILTGHPGSALTEAVLGVVEAMTKDVAGTAPSVRSKLFTMMLLDGVTGAMRVSDGYDVTVFQPRFEDDDQPPATYKGVSGGGLWRVYFCPDGSQRIIDSHLFGVAFYEQLGIDKRMQLVCHGPRSLYEQLLPAIEAKWSDAV